MLSFLARLFFRLGRAASTANTIDRRGARGYARKKANRAYRRAMPRRLLGPF